MRWSLRLVFEASEYLLAARIADQHPSWRNALGVAVVASASNLRTLPGSLLVTVKTLASDESGYRQAIGASAVPAIAWLGVPGGMGVCEAFFARLAPLIGVDVGVGILLGVIDRVASLGFRALAGLGLVGSAKLSEQVRQRPVVGSQRGSTDRAPCGVVEDGVGRAQRRPRWLEIGRGDRFDPAWVRTGLAGDLLHELEPGHSSGVGHVKQAGETLEGQIGYDNCQIPGERR